MQLARDSRDHLSALGVEPWSKGWDFYGGEDSRRNIVGVLLTALFLTYGAPFWFRVLQSTVGLRDVLKPKDEKDNGKTDEGTKT